MNRPITILLVEDCEDDAELVKRMLRQGGVSADYFRVDNEAQLVAALQHSWDVVISDYSMPGFSGLDALRICRAADPDIPFILMSGTIGEDTAVTAMKSGANDYLMKGNLSRLVLALNRALREAAIRVELRHTQARLVESERRFHAFMDAGPLIATIKDESGRYIYMNKGWETAFARDSTAWLGAVEVDPASPRRNGKKTDLEVLRSGMADTSIDKFNAPDGIVTYRKNIRFPFVGGTGKLLLGNFSTDITNERKSEETIRQLAYLDPLTELPNRRLMTDRLSRALVRAARSKRHGALLFIDLDNFKALNDSRGHAVGDQLLREAAHRLSSCVRDQDTVSRTGGDEFVIILEAIGSNAIQAAAKAEAICKKILGAIGQSYALDTVQHHVTASIGITLFCDNRLSPDELMKRADLAMYSVKSAGRNAMMFFDPAMQTRLTLRLALETRLKHGLAHGLFELFYQPQVDIDGSLTGVEGLLRLHDPVEGMLMPADFIPLAEETGLIIELGNFALDTACAQLAAWAKTAATSALTISVNVSARQFRHPGFVDRVLAALACHHANPSLLLLEITESLLFDEIDIAIEHMQLLREHGVQFSLDDFGTGYSSLYYLNRLPLQEIKIDRSFVRALPDDSNSAAIVRAIIALSQSLGLAVIAEGVETLAQRDFLARNGCHHYQGYLFSRPVSVATLALDGFITSQ